MKALALAAALASCAASALFAEDVIADENTELIPAEHKIFSFNAFADIETAYICRGYIWDTRPYSAQSAAAAADLEKFGVIEASIWTQSAMSDKGTSANMGRYAYAEADYLLRYYYDIDIAEGWRLRNGVGRQWVTNPGYVGGHALGAYPFRVTTRRESPFRTIQIFPECPSLITIDVFIQFPSHRRIQI